MLLDSTPLALIPAAPKNAVGADVASLLTRALICDSETPVIVTAPAAVTCVLNR